ARALVTGAVIAAALLGYGGWRLLGPGRSSAEGLCGRGETSCKVPLAVKWTGTGFDVTFAPAVLEVSADALRLALAGRLVHRGATELDELRLTAHFIDDAGKELGQLRFDAQPSFNPALRSGDASAFYLSEKVPPETRRVEVSPGQVHATRAPELYAPSPP